MSINLEKKDVPKWEEVIDHYFLFFSVRAYADFNTMSCACGHSHEASAVVT